MFENIKRELKEHNDHLTNSILENTKGLVATNMDPDELENTFVLLAQNHPQLESVIFFYSVALCAKHSANVLGALLDYCLLHKEEISVDTLHFLYGQFEHLTFVYTDLDTFDNTVNLVLVTGFHKVIA